MKTHISEAHAERLADQRVMTLLARDSAYQNAENAEEQAEREDEITYQVWCEIENTYLID